MNPVDFENLFENKIQERLGSLDPAHDLAHVKRVVSTAKKLAKEENANLEIIIPAAWLHDFVNLPKDHPERKKASTFSADEALKFLIEIDYPTTFLNEIHHAICSHSFSANISPQTMEAKIVQDADRLDALGAIGMYRLFTVSMQMQRNLASALEHIDDKLRIVARNMNTTSATIEANKRIKFIDNYLAQLKSEM